MGKRHRQQRVKQPQGELRPPRSEWAIAQGRGIAYALASLPLGSPMAGVEIRPLGLGSDSLFVFGVRCRNGQVGLGRAYLAGGGASAPVGLEPMAESVRAAFDREDLADAGIVVP